MFITTDQQRYDAYGCNGGAVARTPVTDQLAADGIRYERAYCTNAVCSPARSTMLTGQYPRTHGVVANGIPLPEDAPSVAQTLNDAGYRTALIGKVHFEPIADRDGTWEQNRIARSGSSGPYRGFEHVQFAGHGPQGASHYRNWLRENHPDQIDGFLDIFSSSPGGDTGAPGVADNPVHSDLYHTKWVTDRTIDWLDSLDENEDWFCWVSFPDPHHPWDLPSAERQRVDWRTLGLPPAHPGSHDRIREILAARPAHWLAWYDGTVPNLDGAPANFVPADLTDDQLREINAIVHAKNEMLDEAYGRLLRMIRQKGWEEHTDVIITTDHGEFQGELGLLFKGPFHTDALTRLPLIWRPAPSAGIDPAVITDPVSQVDLAPTFCAIAGVQPLGVMQGEELPARDGIARGHALIEWDSQLSTGYRLRTIVTEGHTCTVYEPNDHEFGISVERHCATFGLPMPERTISYTGGEGELFRHDTDPYQWDNLWDDESAREDRERLVAALYAALAPERETRLRPVAMG